MASDSTEPRETSGATTNLLLRYVRDQGGDRAVAATLALADVPYSVDSLQDTSTWVSYATRLRLFEAATAVLGDPRTAFEIGATGLKHGVHPAIVPLLRAFGSPREVYRQLPLTVPKFTSTSTMDAVECTETSATIRYTLHAGFTPSRLDCEYAQGLFAAVPCMFGLPRAHVEHHECASDGYPACVYRVAWTRLRRWYSVVGRRRADRIAVAALHAQLEEFQQAAADLVSSNDIDQVLDRIVGRAAAAILAPSYLLVVFGTDSSEPVVRHQGLDPEAAADLTGRLLRGDDLGDAAVVADVASTRHVHGRLAAVYAPGYRPMEGDRSLLEAYAHHAAAALDLLIALEDSRLEESRATALLTLAHELASSNDAVAVAVVVANALPRIVGCRAATVLLWDPDLGALEVAAVSDRDPARRALLLATRIRADETPELVEMLTHHSPTVLCASEASPVLAALLAAAGTPSAVVVPLLAGDALLGVAAAAWDPDVGAEVQQTALDRIGGVSEQAAAALQNARLLSTVRRQALHDSLTGLPNRVMFAQSLDATLQAADERRTTAILFCDLDNFKHVNDDLGHGAGDELLRQVAERLRDAVGAQNVIARLGGDEFAVVVDDCEGGGAAAVLARRMVDSLDVPFRIEGRELRITTSVGVAVHPGPDGHGGRLLAASDRAMYEAKKRGRNQVALATEAPRTAPGPSLQAELRIGVARGELRLHFQPVVDVSVAAAPVIVGCEALVRWQHPRLGLLAPAAFLPLAEDTGLVTEIDLWVVGAACAALAARHPAPASLQVAVNLASATLVDPRLLPTVRAALSHNRLAPDRLVLEIIESRSLVDLPGVVERLIELRQLGVRISLDDFGTGFSTLSWLQTLPVDQIKIDRSFTMELPDPRALALVKGVLALAHELGIEVIAEGVETVDQLEALRDAGCLLVQGYLLGRPGPAEHVRTIAPTASLRAGTPRSAAVAVL
ncbi:EAL domain-containing protein [Cellulomonas sp. WB94]|uniref:putative bifunctional diguanylate cyclase/phosphodiesterase n=1 Tax=Cellulomonas sp. WB94 TaxID=2173174 RepID=UPI001304F787|nr:EAL domain-containing protein [Cellulomonas sp. WB94]